MIKGVILDLDGTVYRGHEAVPGVVHFLNRLIDKEISYLFLTNRSNRTPERICEQLQGYGVPCVRENVLTSAQATAAYLKEGSVYCIGEVGLHEALTEAGLKLERENPDYVVVGFDRGITYGKIEKASRLVRGGVP